MSLSRPRTAVVKVIRGFGKKPEDATPAMVIPRKGLKQEQYLSRETRDAMGDQLVAYFEAEMVGGDWWIGKRLPDADRGW